MTLPGKLVIVGTLGLLATGTAPCAGYLLTRPKDVREQLSREGISPLKLEKATSSSDNSNNDYEKWKKILNNGDGSAEDTKAKEFGGWNQENTSEHEKINKLKESCEKSLNTPYKSKNYNEQLKKAKDFCIERK